MYTLEDGGAFLLAMIITFTLAYLLIMAKKSWYSKKKRMKMLKVVKTKDNTEEVV